MGDQSNLEDEMSRFEQEILGGGLRPQPAAPSVVIGASTFTSVQEQLASLRAQVYGGNGPPTSQPQQISNNLPPSNVTQRIVPGSLSGPPRPPGFVPNGNIGNTGPPMAGPQVPPMMSAGGPPRPSSFLPPQLRPRAPGPPGNFNNGPPGGMHRPPMNRPLMQPPPGMMPGMPPGLRPIGPQGTQNSLSAAPVQYNKPAVVEASKVVYSSKPVLNKPTKTEAQPVASTSNTDMNEQSKAKKREAPEVAAASTSYTQAAPAQADPNTADGQPPAKTSKKRKNNLMQNRCIRTAANEVWEDHSLADWDPNDFRVFCGDLGNEVTDEKLAEAFKKYPSLQKTKVIRDRRTHKTKGYGFISFKDPVDYTRAMREMNGKYVGNRPIKLRKSNWRDRNVDVVKKKEREKKRLGFR